jgi:hypothetical protein
VRHFKAEKTTLRRIRKRSADKTKEKFLSTKDKREKLGMNKEKEKC